MATEFIVDASGNRKRVILSIEEHERLVDAAEELEDLRLAEEGRERMRRGEAEFLTWEEAKDQIGKEHAELERRGEL